MLGLELGDIPAPKAFDIPPLVTLLLEKRKAARDANDWALSDSLRSDIRALGYEVKDTGGGQSISVSM